MAADKLDTLTYTVDQTARVLNLSPRQVRYLIANGTLRTLPGLGRRTLISKAWLAHWVETATTISGRPESGIANGPNTAGSRRSEGDPTTVSTDPGKAGSGARPETPQKKNATGPGSRRAQVA